MKLINIIRAKEWWEFKFPPIIAIAYGTAFIQKKAIGDIALHLLLLIVSLIIGAAFVSILNNITDIKEDADCGKANNMSNVSKLNRRLLLLSCILPGLIICWLFKNDFVSVIFYVLCWVSFTLYSVSPFRFKNRKFAGILADAAGSQMFPSLLMVSGISFYTSSHINLTWIVSVGFWSFMYGIRSILAHQFKDRDNDLASGIQTYASSVSPIRFYTKSNVIMGLEILAFVCILLQLNQIFCYLFLVIYIILLFIRAVKYKSGIVAIITPPGDRYQLLMNEYYQVFFPLSLLINSSLMYPFDWMLVAVHVFLFPKNIFLVLRDFYRYFKIIVNKMHVRYN